MAAQGGWGTFSLKTLSDFSLLRTAYAARHALCTALGMNSKMVQTKPARMDGPVDLEQELETWDWARTAGVSAPELRKALQDSLGKTQES